MPKSRSIQIIKADEPWMIVQLVDGTIIKHRVIIMGVLQIIHDDGEPIIDQTGMGQYALQTQSVQIIENSPMIEERQITNNAVQGVSKNVRKN